MIKKLDFSISSEVFYSKTVKLGEDKETSEVDEGPVIRVNNVSVTTHRNKEDNL